MCDLHEQKEPARVLGAIVNQIDNTNAHIMEPREEFLEIDGHSNACVIWEALQMTPEQDEWVSHKM